MYGAQHEHYVTRLGVTKLAIGCGSTVAVGVTRENDCFSMRETSSLGLPRNMIASQGSDAYEESMLLPALLAKISHGPTQSSGVILDSGEIIPFLSYRNLN